MAATEETVNCVIVGENGVGKTSMALSYFDKSFPRPDTVPPTADNKVTELQLGDVTVHLTVCDTDGASEQDALRPLTYADASIFLVVFSVADPDTFNNCRHKWVPEIQQHKPDVPFVLVGAKCDLRDDPQTIRALRDRDQIAVTKDRAQTLASQVGAKGYLECTARSSTDSVKEVFVECSKVALGIKGGGSGGGGGNCCIVS